MKFKDLTYTSVSEDGKQLIVDFPDNMEHNHPTYNAELAKLAGYLERDTTIKSLTIGVYDINFKGQKSLLPALEKNYTLEHVNIYRESILGPGPGGEFKNASSAPFQTAVDFILNRNKEIKEIPEKQKQAAYTLLAMHKFCRTECPTTLGLISRDVVRLIAAKLLKHENRSAWADRVATQNSQTTQTTFRSRG